MSASRGSDRIRRPVSAMGCKQIVSLSPGRSRWRDPGAPECTCRRTDRSHDKEAVPRKHLISRPLGFLGDVSDSGRRHKLSYARPQSTGRPQFALDIAVDTQHPKGCVRMVSQESQRIPRSAFLRNRRDPYDLRIARFRPTNDLVQVPIKIEKWIHRRRRRASSVLAQPRSLRAWLVASGHLLYELPRSVSGDLGEMLLNELGAGALCNKAAVPF